MFPELAVVYSTVWIICLYAGLGFEQLGSSEFPSAIMARIIPLSITEDYDALHRLPLSWSDCAFLLLPARY